MSNIDKYIDKQALRERYSEKPAPNCHICGSLMTIQRAGAGGVVYGCTGRIDKDGEGYKFSEGRDFADDHYARSRVTFADESDPDVLALLDDMEADAELQEYRNLEPVYQCEFCHHDGNGKLQWHWEDVKKDFYDQYDSERRGNRRVLYSATLMVTSTVRQDQHASSALRDVIAERHRQISAEGFTPEQDDRYTDGELGVAAACYIMADVEPGSDVPELWPWSVEYWKPTNLRRDLVKAGALILAEIERLDRQTALREATK